MSAEQRFSRNELLFGARGQAKIGATSVAIVGLGGTGSHVAQQLAYLGTEDFVLVEHDFTTLTGLNRQIGAGPGDATAIRPKIDVAERLIKFVRPEARVRSFNVWIEDAAAQAAVRSCDAVFGCVDDDPARLILVGLTTSNHLPYFDLATDVSEDGKQYGGRVVVSMGGERCLFCMGMLDQRVLRAIRQTPEQRAEESRIYGIQQGALESIGPAVVSLNGVIASLAVTEFMVWATGMREAKRYLVYHAERGIVVVSQDQPAPGCPFCGR